MIVIVNLAIRNILFQAEISLKLLFIFYSLCNLIFLMSDMQESDFSFEVSSKKTFHF